MRIVIVTNIFPTQSETFISNKVIALAERGHAIMVVCSDFDKKKWDLINNNIQSISIAIITKSTLLTHFVFSPSLWMKPAKEVVINKLALTVNSFKADIVHFEFSGIANRYINAFEKIKAKKVVSCRGTGEKVKLLTEPKRREQLNHVFELVDSIHCVSEDMLNTIAPLVNDISKTFVNRPSIKADFFKPLDQNKHSDVINILSVGRFTFQKGFVFGLIAFRKLLDDGIKATWQIIGDGPLHEELIYHRATLKLEEHVFFLGKKTAEEVKEYYSTSDVFFLPSIYEGIANAALEAMSMQLPVVSTKSGGMEEVIKHNENGLLAEVYDVGEMYVQLKELCNNADTRNSLGLKARQTILNGYTLEKQASKFEEIYNSILK